MNITTRRFPRTSREAFGLDPGEANPIQAFHTSRSKRLFYALVRCGWVVVPIALLLFISFKGSI